MLRILGPALLVVMLAACGGEATTADTVATATSTTATASPVVEMYREPT